MLQFRNTEGRKYRGYTWQIPTSSTAATWTDSMTDNNAIRAALAVVAEGATLPAPTSSNDGRGVPRSRGGFRPRRLVLAFESDDPDCSITAPVLVHGHSEGRWRSQGVLNEGASINASQGLEIEIPWNGCERIDVSAAGVAGGTATVKVAPVEVI